MVKLTVFKFAAVLLSVKYSTSNRGFVSNMFMGRKFSCPAIEKTSYTDKSEIQCVHRCLRHEKCDVVNFKYTENRKTNCEVFKNVACTTTVAANGWKGIVFKRVKPKVYKSCNEVYMDRKDAKSGVYDLESGRHFCRMNDIANCNGGGWTLAMKIDGTKGTFSRNSAYWTKDTVYETENGLKSFDENEAKFPAFNNNSFAEVCIGIKLSADVRWLRLPVKHSSLLNIFKSGIYLPTTEGRSAWKGLIASSSLQYHCNREGFNVKNTGNALITRVGIIANEQRDCSSPDSFIGMGSSWMACGNFASATPDNGNKNTPAMCFILIK